MKKNEIVSHIISTILRNTDKLHEYTGASMKDPVSELTEEQITELLSILKEHPIFGENLNTQPNGTHGGISIIPEGNVVMQYSLVGHDRFDDHMSTQLIRPHKDGVKIDTELKTNTDKEIKREIYDNNGNLKQTYKPVLPEEHDRDRDR